MSTAPGASAATTWPVRERATNRAPSRWRFLARGDGSSCWVSLSSPTSFAGRTAMVVRGSYQKISVDMTRKEVVGAAKGRDGSTSGAARPAVPNGRARTERAGSCSPKTRGSGTSEGVDQGARRRRRRLGAPLRAIWQFPRTFPTASGARTMASQCPTRIGVEEKSGGAAHAAVDACVMLSYAPVRALVPFPRSDSAAVSSSFLAVEFRPCRPCSSWISLRRRAGVRYVSFVPALIPATDARGTRWDKAQPSRSRRDFASSG